MQIVDVDGKPITSADYANREEETKAAPSTSPLLSKECEKLTRALQNKQTGYFVIAVKDGKLFTRTNFRQSAKAFLEETVKRTELHA